MATFPSVYFTYSTKYPQSGGRMELSRSYVFTVAPEAPDQRIFQLNLQGLTYFIDEAGAADRTKELGRNMWILEDFYILHRLHTSFQFDHPVYGTLNCKFNRPLEIPEGIPGGNGVLPVVEVELIEIP